MIPLTLELTNFLSYRETARLDFDGIHLACISGLNGAGKSSLLDAMTWCLFGKSRAKSDDDVVNRIAAHRDEVAEVRLVFDLEGTVYRVIRQKRPGRTSVLEFQMQTGGDDWRSVGDGGVRQTQAAIESALRMNYDTFVNASFFLQGQADEFTTKTPDKRKEILADLLSIDDWDDYKAVAAERRKAEENRLMLLDARLQDVENELEEQDAREAELETARTQLATLSDRLADQERILEQMRRIATAMEQQKEQSKRLHESLVRARARLQRLQQTQAQRLQERNQFQALLDEADAIREAHAAWQAANENVEHWQEKAEVVSRLQQERRPHELALERARSRLQQRLQELSRQKERVEELQDEREAVAAALKEHRERRNAVADELAALADKVDQWHEARARLQELEGERTLWQREVAQLQVEKARVQKLEEEKAKVEAALGEATVALEEAATQLETLAQQRDAFNAAQNALERLRGEQVTLREAMDQLKERLQQLQAETGGACPLCGQELSEEHRQEVLADVEADGKQKGDTFRHNKERIAELEAQTAALAPELKAEATWRERQQIQQGRRAEAQARLDEIERSLASWEKEGRDRLGELQVLLADDSQVKATTEEVAALEKAVAPRETLEATRRELEQKESAASARLAEIERATTEWEKAGQLELKQVTARLEEDDIEPAAQAEIARLDEAIAAVGYNEGAHQQARARRDESADAPERYQALAQAEAAVKPLDDTLADLEQEIGEQEETVAHLESQHAEVIAQLEALGANEDDMVAVEKEVLALREQVVAANRRVGAAQQRLAVLDNLRQQRKEAKDQRAKLTLLIKRLKRLEEACGRNGVQALLIERAVPEIEEDANELLERLTGGEMRVQFDTQKELKTRDALAETLDIKIIDSAGERPYENYSGGEQFRVNFAVRLALARILAKRAGARLQTLVIDEGFGSQDPAGRQRLVEAINIVQDDFARVLVITHIGALRDAFPTRIEVEKTATGSHIHVI